MYIGVFIPGENCNFEVSDLAGLPDSRNTVNSGKSKYLPHVFFPISIKKILILQTISNETLTFKFFLKLERIKCLNIIIANCLKYMS